MKIETITSDAPRPLAHYTECFRVGPWVFPAGQLASDYKTGVPEEAKTRVEFPCYGSDIKLQTRYILKNFERTFAAAGSSLDRVVKAQVFLTDPNNFNGFDEVWAEYFKVPPPRTTIGVTGLLVPGALVEIDLIGYVPGHNIQHKVVCSDAPQPLANYSEGFAVGNLLFPAGQVATDFKTGLPAHLRSDPAFPYYGSEIKKQTRFILENLERTFKAAGTSLDEATKAQVYLLKVADFDGFDEVWKEFFKKPPARTTITTSALLAAGMLVEIDLIGHIPSASSKRVAVQSKNPQPLANYTEAFRAGDLVFAAGQVATDFETGVAAEAQVPAAFPYYGSAIKKQTRFILNNLKNTLEAAGSFSRTGREGSSVHEKSLGLFRFRRSLAGVLPEPATAHDSGYSRTSHRRLLNRDRSNWRGQFGS